jgi:hypothetical protein
MLRFLVLGFTALTLSVIGSTKAAAQAWAADRSRAEGHGIRLGNFELHPGIGSELGYDSNVFLSEDAEDSVVLRVAPAVYLSTLSAERLGDEVPKLSFRFGASGAFKYYFAQSEGDIGVGQDAKLTWTPSQVFALELFDTYHRSVDPFGDAVAPMSSDTDQLNFARDQIAVGTRLQLSTKGGLVKGGLGYRFDYDWFEHDIYRQNVNLTHNIAADTSWEFLPKTALFWNGVVQLHQYDDTYADEAPSERNSSTSVSSKLGINGALTQKVGFTVAGGYGAGFFTDDNDFESVIAQVELRWHLRETIVWALGYDRQFDTAFQGNYSRLDRVKTNLQAMFLGALLLGARAELTFVDFGADADLATGANGTTAPAERNDIHILTNLNGEYRFTDWFALTAELGYLQNIAKDGDGNDYAYTTVDADGNVNVDEAKYKRFEAWLGVRAFL